MQSIAAILGHTDSQTRRQTCTQCGNSFELDAIGIWLSALCPITVCPRCSDVDSERRTREKIASASAHHRKGFDLICPPQYVETDPLKLPDPALYRRVMAWEFGPRGLLLHGETGTGKSRCAWALARREYDRGRTMKSVSYSFAQQHAATFSVSTEAARDFINGFVECDLLLVDDVFKTRVTDSVEAALFSVIAQRIERLRPVVVATNDTGASLAGRLSDDRAAPLMRRLRESCDAIHACKPAGTV